jgi:hypothetical protein
MPGTTPSMPGTTPSRGSNVVPGAYRAVSLAEVDVPLTAPALIEHFRGRECYRRTRFIVARHRGEHALVEVTLEDTRPLFSPAVDVVVLALPDETVFAERPEVDTGVPSQLAAVAVEHPGARCIVVEGRYHHVSFLLEPAPLVVRIVEVVPPEPAKLVDQARRVLELAEDLPPMVLEPELVDLATLAPAGTDVLLPCRGSGAAVDGATTWYLDQRPDHHPWVLVGCARSREIHRWFYGADAPNVDVCPRALAAARADDRRDADGLVLTKCCLLEDRIELEPPDAGRQRRHRVVVPWGASLDQVRTALATLAEATAPAWAPA